MCVLAPGENGGFLQIWDAVSAYMMTMVLSVLLTLAFESPVIALEKHLLGGRGKTLEGKLTKKQNRPRLCLGLPEKRRQRDLAAPDITNLSSK